MIRKQYQNDVLIDFEDVKIRPKNMWLIVSMLSLVVFGHAIFLFDKARFAILDYGFNIIQLLFTFLMLLYPAIGIIGLFRLKKFGWYISVHYLLTSVLIWLFKVLSAFQNFELLTHGLIPHFLFAIFVVLTGIPILIYVMRDRFLQIYALNRNAIFFMVLMTIFLPFIFAGLLAALDSL